MLTTIELVRIVKEDVLGSMLKLSQEDQIALLPAAKNLVPLITKFNSVNAADVYGNYIFKTLNHAEELKNSLGLLLAKAEILGESKSKQAICNGLEKILVNMGWAPQQNSETESAQLSM